MLSLYNFSTQYYVILILSLTLFFRNGSETIVVRMDAFAKKLNHLCCSHGNVLEYHATGGQAESCKIPTDVKHSSVFMLLK